MTAKKTPEPNRKQRRTAEALDRNGGKPKGAALTMFGLKLAQGPAAMRILAAVLAKHGGEVKLTLEEIRTAPDLGFAGEDDNERDESQTLVIAASDPNLDTKPISIERLLDILRVQ